MDSDLSIRESFWQIIAMIPEGRVATYGQIARLAGYPSHARLVGNTLKNLPKDTKLPWHRVINAQGKSSFPEASKAYRLQLELLEQEGVELLGSKASIKQFGWDA
jgi:methylated-DNA-protein-cysteine methyltransferase-like protein